MRGLRLSQRMALVTAAAMLPLVAALILNLTALRRSTEARLHEDALRQALLVRLEVGQIVLGAQDVLRTVGAAPIVQKGDVAGCREYVANIVEQLPRYAAIGIVDPSGLVRCHPHQADARIFLGDRGYFAEAVESGEPAVGEYVVDRITGRAVLPIAVPLQGGGIWAGGVAVATLDVGWLGEWLAAHRIVEGASITIADRAGRILAHEPLPDRFVGTVVPPDLRRLIVAEGPGTLEATSQDDTPRVIGYVPVGVDPEGIYLSAGFSVARGYAALDAAATRAASFSIAALAAAVALGWWISHAFLRVPFRRIVATIEASRAGAGDARTNMSADSGELGAIGAAIDDFLDALDAAQHDRREGERQRDLLMRELNHRVKNLLASIQAIARQSFRKSGLGEEGQSFVRRISMMAAANDLLMQDGWQRTTVRKLVETAVAPFADPARRPFELDGPDVTLNSGTALTLALALHELSTNATKYGALGVEGGTVAVSWSVETGAGGQTFRLVWQERDGPHVAEPAARGFGSQLVERALARQIGGQARIAFAASGLRCEIAAPLANVQDDENPAD